MPVALRSFLDRLIGGIREFTVAQRTLAIIGVVAVVIAGIALGAWLTRPNYQTLFSGLSSKDASAIVDQLDTAKVPYQLADGGSTILVASDQVDKERIAVSAAGLPSTDSGGYALLDSLGVTSSEFQQDVTYKRALEGELAKTIESIDGVRTAAVQLAIPKKSVFDSTATDPTASVVVDTQSGFQFSTEQVQAITHLTAASVDGLKPENVSVVDSKGDVLSAVGIGTTGTTDQQANGYQERVRSAVQAMLDKVVGVGNATVVVAADVSQQSAQRVEDSYTSPTGSPATSESATKESFTGDGASASGVLGQTDATTGDASGTSTVTTNGSGSKSGTYSTESSTKDNALDHITQTSTIPAGAITRQTVSVAVNSNVVKNINTATLTGMIDAAAGVDTTRGDAVTVSLVPFSKAGAASAAAALKSARDAEQQSQLMRLITVGGAVGGGIIALIIVILMVGRMRRKNQDGSPTGGTLDDSGFSDLDATRALALGLQPHEITMNTPPAAIFPREPAPLEAGGYEQMRADIEAMAANDPQRTAEYLRGLMAEEPGR